MRINLSKSVVVATLVVASMGLADDRVSPGKIAGDTRLQRKVSIARGRIYLGELVDKLSADSQVPLDIGQGKGNVDGIQLTAFLQQCPVGEVMQALAELLSTPYNRWEWQKSAAGRGFVLRHQYSMEQASARARRAVFEGWAKDARTVYEIARLPDEQREARAAGRRELFAPSAIGSFLCDQLSTLTPVEFGAVLSGAFIPVDPSRRPLGAGKQPEAQGEAGSDQAAGNRPGFILKWSNHEIGPVLWLSDTQGGATNAIGGSGWDHHWSKTNDPDWVTELDSAPQEFRRRTTRGEKGLGGPTTDRTVPGLLKRVAPAQGIQVLYDPVSPGDERRHTFWAGTTPEQTMLALVTRADLAWRQSGKVHLLRRMYAGIHARGHLVSWADIQRLRKAAARNHGYLANRELLWLAEQSPEQLAGLAEEFPDATALIIDWRPILQFYANLPAEWQARVRSQEGMRFAETGVLARTYLVEAPDPRNIRGLRALEANARQATVSLQLIPSKALVRVNGERVEREVRQLVWEIHTSEGLLHRSKYQLQPRAPLQPE